MKHFKTLCCLCFTAWKREAFEMCVFVFSKFIPFQFTNNNKIYIHLLLTHSGKIDCIYYLYYLLVVHLRVLSVTYTIWLAVLG